MTQRSWYETGYEGAKREQDKKQLGYPPDRLWQKPGAMREIVFVDDDPFCIKEFAWRDYQGDWQFETDPGLASVGPHKSQYVGHYTIIDVSGYKDKEGVDHKFRLMLLPGKTRVLGKLKAKKEQKGSLLKSLYTLSRADEHTPSTGDDLDHVREVDMEKLYGLVTYKGKSLKDAIDRANSSSDEGAKARKYLAHHFQIPAEGPIPAKIPAFNYQALFVPKETDVLRELLREAPAFGGKGAVGGGGKQGSSSASDDSVPF